ncbi:hypothetical protein V8E54_013467 [Elaphomyces granulatus]
MHFLKAISVLACAIPVAFATDFYNDSPEFIAVEDSVGTIVHLNTTQFFTIENGFAITSFSSTDGSFCNPFIYKWKANLPEVHWTLNTGSTYMASLTDKAKKVIPQKNGTPSMQKCSGPSPTPTPTPVSSGN